MHAIAKRVTTVFILILCLGLLQNMSYSKDTDISNKLETYHRYLFINSYLKGGICKPHWMADGSSFWYAEGMPDNTIIYTVNPESNSKEPLFDTARLRQALADQLGHNPPYKGVPFSTFSFIRNEHAIKFTVEGKRFICELDTYTITQFPAPSQKEKDRMTPHFVRKGFPAGRPDVMEILSPYQRWFLGVKDNNLYLRSTYDGLVEQLTSDGRDDHEWMIEFQELRPVQGAKWSPDGRKLAAPKVDFRKVDKLPITYWLKQKLEVDWIPFVRSGAAMPEEDLYIIDIFDKTQVRIDMGDKPDHYLSIVGWRPDGSELIVGRMDREKKKVELMAADPETGKTRMLLTESQKTFVEGLWPSIYTGFRMLQNKDQFIWTSERDGWAHLYLYDLKGKLTKQLTKGTFPVLRIITIDESSGWVYFTAHAEERLYDTHLYRVRLDGTRFQRLTEATGSHVIRFSPSKEFFIDIHSHPNRTHSSDLRKADGTFLQTLTKTNDDELMALPWSPPEEFIVKAADGKTDLYGILYKPSDFDSGKKYPVIEAIYAGPQTVTVPHSFIRGRNQGQAMAQLGYIVFTVDARGTPERGKAFQDVVFRNIGRNEIPDHVAALKQLAANRPYMDLSRVGIFGGSFGGYFTLRAMLLAPDVYHVGVSSAPAVDLYIRNAPIESYMELPQKNKEGYEYGSCPKMADKLKGKLLLIHGTSDINATFDATMKMVEALIRADKQFDLLVMPDIDHTFGRLGKAYAYFLDAIARYFLEHLPPEN